MTRGFDFFYAFRIFNGSVTERPDDRNEYGETRIRVAGLINQVPFMLVYTMRGDVTRIISAWRMHDKEWGKWRK